METRLEGRRGGAKGSKYIYEWMEDKGFFFFSKCILLYESLLS